MEVKVKNKCKLKSDREYTRYEGNSKKDVF